MKKNIEKVIVSGLIAVFVMSLLAGLMPYDMVQLASAASSKKAPIHINNTAGDALSYYQVNLNVTYDSDMNNNFSDLRVKNETAGVFVPYWIEDKVDGSYANIWFKGNVSSGWDNNTHALYYGDAAASSASNITNTFLFGDDFEGGANATTSSYLTGWTKSGSNPLKNIGSAQGWFAAVYNEYDSKFYLYIQDKTGNDTEFQCYSFNKTDAETPANWTDHGSIYNTTESWEDGWNEPHSVIWETQAMADAREGVEAGEGTQKWRIYYCAKPFGSTNYATGFATAPEDDMTNLTAYSGNPVYPHDASHTYPDCRAVIYNNEVWMLLGYYIATTPVDCFFTHSTNGLGGAGDPWTDCTNHHNTRWLMGTPHILNGGITIIRDYQVTPDQYHTAYTTDGETLVSYSGNPVLTGGTSGEWDGGTNGFSWNSVAKMKNESCLIDGYYYLFYMAVNTSDVHQMGLAKTQTVTEEQSYSLDKWEVSSSDGGSHSVTGDILKLEITAANDKRHVLKALTPNFDVNHSIRFRERREDRTNNWLTYAGMHNTELFTTAGGDSLAVMNHEMTERLRTRDEGTQTEAISTYDSSAWHVNELKWKSGEVKWYVNNTLKATNTTNIPNDNDLRPSVSIRTFNSANPGSTKWSEYDWIIVRKYASPEPTALLGTKQTTACTTPTISSLTNSTPGTTNVTVTWTTNQSADNRVKYSKNSDLSNEEWSSWDNATTSISIDLTSLDANTPYYYQAWSYNGTNATCYVTEPTSQPYKTFTTQSTGGAYEITLSTGWNIIGWTDTSATNAEALETDIGSNCTYSTTKNLTSGVYETHQHGFGLNNFDVERGWGYFVYVTDQTVWNRSA